MASLTRPPARLSVLLALLAAGVAVAGCATAPASGPPRQAPGGSNQVQAYVQELPAPGPTSKWSPRNVVLGFLHASASYVFDPAAAKQYLVPELRKQWHPGREPVAVVGAPSVAAAVAFKPQPTLGQAPQEETVQVTGQHLATLSQTGQYQYAPGQNVHYQFVLARSNGVWLIEQLPVQQALLLTLPDFQDVYAPRNLFFFARPGAAQTPTVLVPDPVYAPLLSSNSALNTDLATGLVNGLLKGQGSWLSGTTVSAFPRGTRLLKKVTITGKTARVDLGGAAAHAQPLTVAQMAGQLLATLSDGEYSPPLASRLELYIDNRPWSILGPIGSVPDVAGGQILLVTSTGNADSISQLPDVPRPGAKPKPVPAQLGQDASVTAVAASPDPTRAAMAVAVQSTTGTGCTVEVRTGSQSTYQSYPLPGSTSMCTSLSYDANGNLWAAAGSGAWFMQPNRNPVPVYLGALAATLQHGGQIMALRIAPDAVRAALLVHPSTGGNKLLLAAVRLHAGTAALGQPVTVGAAAPGQAPSITDPQAISWYDAYHLAVLTPGGIYDVPLTGGAGQQPGAAPYLFGPAPTGAVSLTTDGSELVVGTSTDVWAASVSDPSFLPVAQGTDPIYPG